MSETLHTPGPWEFDGCVQIVESARPHMRVCFLPSDHHEYATSKANGHLIAAAPDLLEALREIADFPYVGTQASQKVETIARAAIAKATGRVD